MDLVLQTLDKTYRDQNTHVRTYSVGILAAKSTPTAHERKRISTHKHKCTNDFYDFYADWFHYR